MYNCIMKPELTNLTNNKLFLEQKGEYFYTVKPVEICNALGAVTAILEEYFITNSAGEKYKLYRTKEGNWYDVEGANSGADFTVLRALKLAINNHEKEIKIP
jgi:hypothetical protein